MVGSLDEAMHVKCLEQGVPSIYLNGSSILQTGPVKYFNTGAQRASAFKRRSCRWRGRLCFPPSQRRRADSLRRRSAKTMQPIAYTSGHAA